MPIYEYRCNACGHELEKLQRMSDNPLTDCPACEQPELKRLISAAGFRLKGSGWYETDFKTGQKRNVAGAESGEPSKPDAKDDGAKDSGKSQPGTDTPKKESSKTESSGKSASKDKSAA